MVTFERRGYKILSRHSSVTIMHWDIEERALAIEAYFPSGCSVIATQHAFRNHYNLALLAPARTGNQLLRGSLLSDKLQVRQDDELESLGLLDHLRTLRQ